MMKTFFLATETDARAFTRQIENQHSGLEIRSSIESILREIGHEDRLVIFEDIPRMFELTVPNSGVYLCTAEPPVIRTYSRSFLSQFSGVISPHKSWRFLGLPITDFQLLPWHVGWLQTENGSEFVFDARSLRSEHPAKTRKLSVVVSNKTMSPGHRNRLKIVSALKAEFGPLIDVYGRGINEVSDKFTAMAPYEFHLVFENSRYPGYWSEKLADAYLAECFPIYWGDPAITKRFPQESLCQIGALSLDSIISKVRTLLHTDLDSTRSIAILEAKRRVLEDYNITNLGTFLPEKTVGNTGRARTFFPQSHFSVSALRRFARNLKLQR